jgi:hypothetical protein
MRRQDHGRFWSTILVSHGGAEENQPRQNPLQNNRLPLSQPALRQVYYSLLQAASHTWWGSSCNNWLSAKVDKNYQFIIQFEVLWIMTLCSLICGYNFYPEVGGRMLLWKLVVIYQTVRYHNTEHQTKNIHWVKFLNISWWCIMIHNWQVSFYSY